MTPSDENYRLVTCAVDLSEEIERLREEIVRLEQGRIVEFCGLQNENSRLRDRIKELEVEKEGIQTAQSAMAEAMESTRKRMHRMQQIFGNLTMAHKIQCEAAQAVVDRWETPLWKDVEPTAAVIYRLRDILSNREVIDPKGSIH